MDHSDYTVNNFEERQFDTSSEYCDNVNDINSHKHGDELLIDLVRSRPYLYDKTQREYKNTNIKENAWIEMASILNITVSDCQTRWTRLRQRYSKERILREQETRSGAGKPTRSKWFLFDSLNFLGKHIAQRNITNMSFSQSPTSIIHQANKGINQDSEENIKKQKEITSPQITSQMMSFSQNTSVISRNNISSLELEQHQSQLSGSAVKQNNISTPSPIHIYDTQPTPVLTPPPSQQSIATIQHSTTVSERSAVSSPQPSTASSSHQLSLPSDSDSEILSPPSTCFMGKQKSIKKRKIDPIESTFSQINTTLNTMAMQVC
ncbi:PREDICTED: uncharacterized protein LOC105571054 isoform X2 [Vollenhovia emeryi]|uniref:uncharacterized protein LOC105571054 isoform X2 n=1 Tax=Vollenhovia emeryi TaxID=411798 RepID=UPI0005F46182|nr:PREDICTED: uncharacterized protein LOC105571054 isoform X2 [Vollenhovia emeryi]